MCNHGGAFSGGATSVKTGRGPYKERGALKAGSYGVESEYLKSRLVVLKERAVMRTGETKYLACPRLRGVKKEPWSKRRESWAFVRNREKLRGNCDPERSPAEELFSKKAGGGGKSPIFCAPRRRFLREKVKGGLERMGPCGLMNKGNNWGHTQLFSALDKQAPINAKGCGEKPVPACTKPR